jgi:hypothetical protein
MYNDNKAAKEEEKTIEESNMRFYQHLKLYLLKKMERARGEISWKEIITPTRTSQYLHFRSSFG